MFVAHNLEAKLRSNGQSEIVVDTAIEVHQVTCFDSDSEPSRIGFNATAWVEGSVRVPVCNVSDRTLEVFSRVIHITNTRVEV